MADDERLRFIPATPDVIELGDFRPGPPREYVAFQVVKGEQLKVLADARRRKEAIARSGITSTEAFGGYNKR